MNQKLYSTLRLMLGIFILLGLLETGNMLFSNYRQTVKTITHHSIAALQKEQKKLQLVVLYCSQLVDSTQKHLS